jgi:large conductance mechanosensitive channel
MSLIKEFKTFAMRGNILDLAIAVIIGGAFGAIVSSLVDDLLTPLILNPALQAAHATDLDQLTWGSVKYGKFLAAILKFIMIAVSLFAVVKAANKFKHQEDSETAGPSETEKLLAEIRDELRKNR